MNHTDDHFAARARGFLEKGKLDLEHASVLRFFRVYGARHSRTYFFGNDFTSTLAEVNVVPITR